MAEEETIKNNDLAGRIKSEETTAIKNLRKIFPNKKETEQYISNLASNYISLLNTSESTNEELRKTKEELDEAKKNIVDLVKLIKTINHDLRNPIGNTYSIMNLLAEQYKSIAALIPNLAGSEEQKQFDSLFNAANSSAQASLNIFETYHDLTNKSISKESNIQKHNIDDMIIEISPNLKYAITDSKKVNLSYKSQAGEQTIYADKSKVAAVLINLISNSVKFTPEGKNIYILSEEFKEDSEYIKVSVQDEGRAIPPEVADKLFKEKITTLGINKEKGSGTGMIRCLEYVTEMGGTIWIDKSVTTGAKVSFTLPKNSPLNSYVNKNC